MTVGTRHPLPADHQTVCLGRRGRVRGKQRKGPGQSQESWPRPEQLDLVKKLRLVIRRLFLPEGSPERVGERTEERLRLQELGDSQAEAGAASLFTPGGASDFTARVFWEKLSFPHLDGGRAQLLLLSLPSPYSHGCHAWGRCRRVLRGPGAI